MQYLLILLLDFLLVACSAAPQAAATPTASPIPVATVAGDSASILVIVYHDLNQNTLLDPGEPGVGDQVGLAPDTNCTIGDPAVILPAGTNPTTGEALYPDLTPGDYCVMYLGEAPLTTPATVDLSLSRGQHAVVAFGLAVP